MVQAADAMDVARGGKEGIGPLLVGDLGGLCLDGSSFVGLPGPDENMPLNMSCGCRMQGCAGSYQKGATMDLPTQKWSNGNHNVRARRDDSLQAASCKLQMIGRIGTAVGLQ